MDSTRSLAQELARFLLLGGLLDELRRRWGGYELLDHWQQGEFHHDVVVRVPRAGLADGGDVVVVATNCNGGVKEVLCFTSVPDRRALWHARCPENPEFSGELAEPLASARTEHWFDPCELLVPDARSEYREEFRERQCGGGWMARRSTEQLKLISRSSPNTTSGRTNDSIGWRVCSRTSSTGETWAPTSRACTRP